MAINITQLPLLPRRRDGQVGSSISGGSGGSSISGGGGSSTPFDSTSLYVYVDGSFGLRDASIMWLNTNKAPKESPVFTTKITTPIVYGSSVANGDLTLRGTSHATKTSSYLILQDTGGNVGINTTAPQAKLHIHGDGDQNLMLQNAAIGFADDALTYGDLTLGRWEPYFLDLANWGDAPENAAATVFRISAHSTLGKESTLALVRGDYPNIEFLDLYNNGYADSSNYGIRIQKRGTGVYRDFRIEHSDGVAAVQQLMNFDAIGNIYLTPTSNTTFTGNVNVLGKVHTDTIDSSLSYVSGYTGTGFKLCNVGGKIGLEIDDLLIRGTLSASVLEIKEITSVGGSLAISRANGIPYSVVGTRFYFDTNNNANPIQFVVNDYIKAQIWTGIAIGIYEGQVTNVVQSTTLGSAYIDATTITGTPWNNMKLFQKGNSTDTSRQSLIYITAADSNNPYIDILSGVNTNSFANKQIFRAGNLTGITDANFGGALNGDGVYLKNIYATGNIIIGNPEDIDQTALSNAAAAGAQVNTINAGDGLATLDSGASSKLGGIAYNAQVNTINAGDGLNALDSAANTKLAGIAPLATVGATWGTNLNSIPTVFATVADNKLAINDDFIGFHATGTNWPVKISNDAGTGKFYVGNGTNYMDWNGSVLSVVGAITATTGLIGGFNISTAEGLYSGSVSTRVQMKPGVGFWAGATAEYDAPFKVSEAGVLRASGAQFRGSTTSEYLYNHRGFYMDGSVVSGSAPVLNLGLSSVGIMSSTDGINQSGPITIIQRQKSGSAFLGTVNLMNINNATISGTFRAPTISGGVSMDSTLVVTSTAYVGSLYSYSSLSADTNITAGIDIYAGGNCSALSFTDRTPFYEGDAIKEIMAIKGKKGKIDHSTLPAFASKTITKNSSDNKNIETETGRDLGAMISMLTVAVQQLTARIENLEKDPSTLKNNSNKRTYLYKKNKT